MSELTGSPDAIADRVLQRMSVLTLGPPRWVRVLLTAAVAVQMALALPWLVGADPFDLLGDADQSHLTRDGAFGVALGLAGAVTAWRHRYAIAAVIVGAALLVVQFATGIIDGHAGRVSLWLEVSHLLVPVIVILIVITARPEATFDRRSPRPTDPRPSMAPEPDEHDLRRRLRLVAPAEDD